MRICLSILTTLLLVVPLAAQPASGLLDDYRRNSLATIMIVHPEDKMCNYLVEAFEKIPIPDKYDDHNYGLRFLMNDSIRGAQRNKIGLAKASYGKSLTSSEIRRNGLALEKWLNDHDAAKFLTAKWFNFQCDDRGWCHFDTELIQQRGQYNASDIDVERALLTTRGVAALSDAGEELLQNTYILVNDITYVTAEERTAVAASVMGVFGAIADALVGNKNNEMSNAMSGITSAIGDEFEGFTVKTHSYLFKLEWNDSIAEIFYNEHYCSTPDELKVEYFALDPSTYRVKYVAHEYELDTKSKLKGKYQRGELIKMVCTRSMDKNIAALQLQYEDFKVKTPVYHVQYDEKGRPTTYTAKIGLKEGIDESTKFQVVERRIDPETGRTSYRKVAIIKPVRGKIWDNRYNAVTEGDPGATLNATTFRKVSGGEILPGMLIIEGQYRKAKE